eukprot:TRINITY_DN2939_c0_g2_i1.p1 TRINITY_DN2939_c0_g2~~TRINITY_DN2939_c0_g2_i1.p1  ORF type:complete len:1088 (-),score=416.38 TRINITY_DN2939_c0_g2_i1:26-3289(-)
MSNLFPSSKEMEEKISKIRSKMSKNEEETEGKLGTKRPFLVRESAFGVVEISEEGLEAESHSNFSSFRASVCVYSGKWMYEVTLGTAGIQQIGWATIDCPFTNEEGVGDSVDSFAYDGKRIKKWNAKSSNYGEAWMAGDIIASCIDLDAGSISFYRNGKSLGVAFPQVKHGENAEGMAYFPAFSLSQGERCSLNFGSAPFQFPVVGFQSLQSPLSEAIVEMADYLFSLFSNFLEENANELDTIRFISSISEYLRPFLLKDYIQSSHVYPLMRRLMQEEKNQAVQRAFQMFLLCLNEEECHSFVNQFFTFLGNKIRTIPLIDPASSWRPLIDIQMVCILIKLPGILSVLLSTPFSNILESFFTIKQPNNVDLAQLFPVVWWTGTEEDICSKEKMDESFQLLRRVIDQNESYLMDICKTFIESNFIDPKSNQSAQTIFKNWIRSILSKNKGVNRNIQPPGLSDSTVLSNLYFVILKLLKEYFESGKVSEFPLEMFFNNELEYFDFSRIGGLINHLNKNLAIQSAKDIQINPSGKEEEMRHFADQFAEKSKKKDRPLQVFLFDSLIILHHLGMSTRFKSAAMHLQNQISTIAQLDDTNKRIKRASGGGPVGESTDRLLFAKKAFRDDVIEHVRVCAWIGAMLYSSEKQELMFKSEVFLVELLSFASHFDPIFSYIPECYLEVLVDSFHALRRGDPPFPLCGSEEKIVQLTKIIEFLIEHFNDKRIINPDIRDFLLQSLSVLLQYHDFVRVFERPEVNRSLFMHSMLEAFDARFWIPIANILLRFWRGTGFGQAVKRVNDCSSQEYQNVFRNVCSEDMNLLSEFINRVFNNLNWAITEFGVASKELQTTASSLPFAINAMYPELIQHQRKCNVMFELSICLIRIVELVSLEIPNAFMNNDINISRLAELLIFVLTRTTTGGDAKNFDSLIKLENAALEKINRLSIFSPAVGIIANLHSYHLQHKTKTSLSKMIASTGGFRKEIFDYLLNFDWNRAITDQEIKVDEKLKILSQFNEELCTEMDAQDKKDEELANSNSDDMCSICCSAEVDTRFVPCGHRSCNRCINRHLLNNKKCFFCNAQIENVVLDSKVE